MQQPQVILASSSPFRQELLQRLRIPFKAISPDVDESIRMNEGPVAFVRRLAEAKAAAIAHTHRDAIVIGSDQCTWLNGEILGKPGNHEKALQQLKQAQGQEVVFYTGLCVLQVSQDFNQVDCIEFKVGFRDLTDSQLDHYLRVEEPYNCAGSFKSEAYGISLFSYMNGDDPTALIGLPLIRLTAMLEQAGLKVV